jgi:hypothetical protein
MHSPLPSPVTVGHTGVAVTLVTGVGVFEGVGVEVLVRVEVP